MTSIQEQAEALRAQADALEALGRLEGPFLEAKARFRAKPTKANREKYHERAAEFAATRSAARSLAVALPTDGSSVTVVPPTLQKGG